MRYFCWKIAERWGAPPPDPLASCGWGKSPQTSIGLRQLGAPPQISPPPWQIPGYAPVRGTVSCAISREAKAPSADAHVAIRSRVGWRDSSVGSQKVAKPWFGFWCGRIRFGFGKSTPFPSWVWGHWRSWDQANKTLFHFWQN